MAMQDTGKIPPNALFYLIGFVVIMVGIGLVVIGVTDMMTTVQRYESPLRGDGPAAFTSAAALVSWGAFVITMGRIMWRGARRRGVKDRVGRLLCLISLALVGLAIQALLAGVPEFLRSTTAGEARSNLIQAHIPYVALMIPAMIIGLVGSKMAKETKPLITVSTGVNFSSVWPVGSA